MPELADDMYCSQQICIPPSFPYLLRQYAKAAIRTQPGDLLRWSTAYFRCLALNLPPPVKPRLEYPIPKAHFGLTPGWLRALMHQLQNNLTVPFKILWDRWIGACLQHQNLIEVLVLGGFRDPYAVEWFRFVAICAAHLTENLTQTMIMVCEILTEEPEGGSAMIPLEVFTDVYKWLAEIDASQGQWLRNLIFTDSLLSLFREPPVVKAKEVIAEVEAVEEEESVEAEEEKEEIVEAGPEEDLVGVVISCPDIAADDYKTEEEFLDQERERQAKEAADKQKVQAKAPEKSEPAETEDEDKPPTPEEETPTPATPVDPTLPTGTDSVDTLEGYMPERAKDEEVEEELQIVVEKESEEAMGEEEEEEKVDEDLEKLKRILEGAPGALLIGSEFGSEESERKEEEMAEEEEEKGELIYIEAIPGIGAPVPKNLVEAVVTYMKECSMNQHGMVMPRNIRHFNCPPLEICTS